jgi:asparagine synthase (glutamine-hydrolysing)
MSGIAGFWRFDSNPPDASHLERMLDAIRHRGPKSVGTWSGGGLLMGHRLIAPVSERSPLPAIHAPSGLVVTADARLDNAAELASELGLDPRSLPADTAARDAGLILAAYRKWGKDCPDKLLGDFAFAIWDPGNRILFLARDPFGIRPLIYYHSPSLFAFGSEAKALLAHPEIPKVLNRGRVADYLVPWLEGLDFESTFFEKIFRLPAGSTLTISADTRHPKAERWFHLDPDVPELRLPSDRDYEEAFLDQFTGAVDRCLKRPGAVGAMLSGGLDSSSICAVAQRLLGERGGGALPVFSAISAETPPGIETESIEAVIQHTGVAPHRLIPDDIEDLDVDTANAIRQSDDLFDLEITIIPALFAAAARNGCSTLMTGVDGDISAGASSRYLIYLLKSGHLLRVARESIGMSRNMKSGWRYAAHLLAFSVGSVLAPGCTRRRHRQQMLAMLIESSVINRKFADEIDVLGRLGRIFDYELPEPEPLSLSHRHALLIQSPSLTVALERYDRGAHRFSIEPAHPFLDRRLVEFAMSLPDDQRVRQGWGKWILRRAIGDQLPAVTCWRRENDNVNWQFADAAIANLIRGANASMSDPYSRVGSFIDMNRLPGILSRRAPATCSLVEHAYLDKVRSPLLLNRWLEEHFPD